MVNLDQQRGVTPGWKTSDSGPTWQPWNYLGQEQTSQMDQSDRQCLKRYSTIRRRRSKKIIAKTEITPTSLTDYCKSITKEKLITPQNNPSFHTA